MIMRFKEKGTDYRWPDSDLVRQPALFYRGPDKYEVN